MVGRLAWASSVISIGLVVTACTANEATTKRDTRAAHYSRLTSLQISSESELDSLVRTPIKPLHEQGGLSIAYDGRQYLAAWVDGRSGSRQVVAARMTVTGSLLDPVGIWITSGQHRVSGPTVSCLATHCLVTWVEVGGTQAQETVELYAARITPDGTLLDRNGLRLATSDAGNEHHNPPAVATIADQNQFFVAWNTGSRLKAAVLSNNLSGSIEAKSIEMAFLGFAPAVTVGTDGYVVTFIYVDQVSAMRVTRSGDLVDSAPLSIRPRPASGWLADPAIAFDGTNLLVVWQENIASTSLRGILIDSDLKAIGSPFTIDTGIEPHLAFHDGAFHSAYHQSGDAGPNIMYRGITTSGQVGSPHKVASYSEGSARVNMALAAGPQKELISTWIDFPYPKVLAARLDPALGSIDNPPIGVALHANHEFEPSATFGSGQYTVSWSIPDDATFTARLGVDRGQRDPLGILIAEGTDPRLNVAAQLEDDSVLMWHDAFTPRVTRIASDGTVRDIGGLEVAARSSFAHIACGSTSCLLAWMNSDTIRGRTFSKQGELGPEQLVLNKYTYAFDLERRGSDYVLAWNEPNPTQTSSAQRILIQAISAEGVPNGEAIQVSPENEHADFPDLASRNGETFVVWRSVDGLRGARVSAEGLVLDKPPLVICAAAGEQHWARAVATKSGYFVAWQDERNYIPDIFGTPIAQDGTVQIADGAALSADGYHEERPVLANRTGTDEVLLAYSHFDERIPYGSMRIGIRTIDAAGVGGASDGGAGSTGFVGEAGAPSIGGSAPSIGGNAPSIGGNAGSPSDGAVAGVSVAGTGFDGLNGTIGRPSSTASGGCSLSRKPATDTTLVSLCALLLFCRRGTSKLLKHRAAAFDKFSALAKLTRRAR